MPRTVILMLNYIPNDLLRSGVERTALGPHDRSHVARFGSDVGRNEFIVVVDGNSLFYLTGVVIPYTVDINIAFFSVFRIIPVGGITSRLGLDTILASRSAHIEVGDLILCRTIINPDGIVGHTTFDSVLDICDIVRTPTRLIGGPTHKRMSWVREIAGIGSRKRYGAARRLKNV